MILRKEVFKLKKRFKKYPNIYLALSICLIAVGVGTVVSLRNSTSGVPEEADFSRISVHPQREVKFFD